MFIKRLHIILLLFCFLTLKGYSKETAGGLLFTSSAEKVDKRTSMVIFGDKHLKLEDSFKMSFDLSIWGLKQFGHIFRLINEQKKEVEFVFVNFYGIDNMYLDFHSPITHKSVKIPISKESIEQKEFFQIEIEFDLKKDKTSIKLKDSVYTCSPVGLENPSVLQFAFGLYGLNLDVPQMLIRNLRIENKEGKVYFFPLTESSGNFAKDETGKVKATVKNPEWVVNKHFYWETKLKFKVKDKAFVTYDEYENRILIIDKDSVLNYYPRTENVEIFPLNLPSGFQMVDAIYDQNARQCLILSGDSGRSFASTSKISDNLNAKFISPKNGRNLLHHNNFFSVSGDLYQFGGYGNYSYSDNISKLNQEMLNWEELGFSGDRITPRFYSAIGNGVNPNEFLVFGGFGNETGKQEHVGYNLYDLYTIDLNEQKITKLWEMRNTPKNEFVPGNNLILSKDKLNFYALCFAHHKSNSIGYLQRFNLENGIFEMVSDSIRLTSEDMNTTVNLFFNQKLNEFYAVISELTSENETNIQVYSLLSPPILKSQLGNPYSFNTSKLFLFAALGLLVLLLSLYAYKKSKKKDKQITTTIKTELLTQAVQSENYSHKQSAVYLFGAFTAFDKNGMDISYRFSTKLRALFIIILLTTKQDSKISTEKLTSYLWPDKDMNEAKNIRGVTINRLRNILVDMEGISLVHESSHWHFNFTDAFYCDYLEYSLIVSQIKDTTSKESLNSLMDQLIPIVEKGPILYNSQDEIIEKYKSKEEEKLEIILREFILSLNAEKDYKRIVQISSAYFAVEPLNDEIMEISYRAYNKLGKKDEAKLFLNNYKKLHQMMTGEDYKGVL